jgi:DNA-binding transcriptional ArsR family regulator
MTADHSQVEEVLAALADPTRRQLLDVLAARGTATATVLAADMPVTRQAVVKHLAILSHVGLVRGQRQGREMRYTLRPQPLGTTARWMERLAADWDVRLAAIKRLAENDRTADSDPDSGAAGGTGDEPAQHIHH